MTTCLPGPELTDAVGVSHPPAAPGARIVSLVPSLTELLCDLGLAPQLVGRTGFCIHPREVVKGIPKVGGTKDVRIERIRELAPTHLVVNKDENEKPTVEKLAQFIPHIIATFPCSPLDNPPLYRLLGGIFGRAERAETLCQAFLQAFGELARAAGDWPRERVLYLIWKAPWMTISRDTYISGFLAAAGWDTVPAEAVARYPRISLTSELMAGTDRVLLSSEPYSFGERHVAELKALFPPQVGVQIVQGDYLSWYGSRAITGLAYLRALRQELSQSRF
ncbi:MAG TPA: helical backbone metal receptor [Burkholderiales bacterium]|nr:helical backbone metal receptor [Burkholderiales bacterium]